MSNMANAVIALNDNFHFNYLIAKGLQNFLSPNERKIIQLWFDKLTNMNKNVEQIIIRNDYMWFILLMLHSRKIRDPFTKLPPQQILTLQKFVPIQVYEEVLICSEPNMIWARKASEDDIFKIREKRGNWTTSNSL